MSITRITPFLLLFTIGVSLSSCDPKEAAVFPPEAMFFVSPQNGNTTTIFRFSSLETDIKGTVDTMLFFRWDWDNDGVWDTHFSRSRSFDHRFWTKGTYTVVMEASSEGGLRDTLSTTIEVIQGYSAPHPVMFVTPGAGHKQTLFTFDASETTDDEEPIEELTFRWDFDGDGFFDTQWASEQVIEYRYPAASLFKPTVQVRDPKGLVGSASQELKVSLNNPDLVVDFSWTPEDGTTADIFVFDASGSYDPADENNTFTYRWDFDANGFYDTEYIASPTIEHQFDVEGDVEVRLEIADQYGLINTITKPIFVAHANRAPIASFFAGVNFGNTTTNFYFDASAVKDNEDWDYQLEVRWDFDSDGVWDTNYSTDKTVTHKYGVAGTFTITMEVKDTGGRTSRATTEVSATTGTFETGIAIDSDTGDHYGTVKIGNQWWFAENLKNATGKTCYNNNATYCEIYGGLYTWTNAMGNSEQPKARGLCPQGWHIPTVDEWQQLIDYLGESNARTQLEVGGPTDFNMVYAGQVSSSGGSQYAGQIVNFWTSSKGAGDNGWAYSLQNDKDQVWKLSLGVGYRNSVRCIKN